MEFFTPGGYKTSLPAGVPLIAGSIIAPSLKPLPMLLNKNLAKVAYYGRRLLDPQLYLAELDANTCGDRCTKLATYGWFDVGDLQQLKTPTHAQLLKWIRKSRKVIGEYWSGRLPEGAEIDAAIRAALATQQLIDSEALIVPGPLTIDVNSDLSRELDWLDRGLAIGHAEFDRPILATVAISDRALRGIRVDENPLIELILDHISAREPDGVYIVLELANETGYYCTSQSTVGALLRLVDGFKRRAGLPRVVVNYATVAGLITLAAGADTWCTAWYKSERRLRLDDCADKTEGAAAYPAYYSHPLASEIHLGNDMARLVDAGMLDDLADSTTYSEPLLTALRRGLDANEVLPWRHRRNNLKFSKGHFSTAMARETQTLTALSQEDRFGRVDSWLAHATDLATKINALGDLHPRTEITHQRNWLKAFREFLDSR